MKSKTDINTETASQTVVQLPEFPTTFKLKRVLKEISRFAISTVGKLQYERRLLIIDEIKSINQVLSQVPGLIGPRLPQVVAMIAYGKSEVFHHIRNCVALFHEYRIHEINIDNERLIGI